MSDAKDYGKARMLYGLDYTPAITRIAYVLPINLIAKPTAATTRGARIAVSQPTIYGIASDFPAFGTRNPIDIVQHTIRQPTGLAATVVDWPVVDDEIHAAAYLLTRRHPRQSNAS